MNKLAKFLLIIGVVYPMMQLASQTKNITVSVDNPNLEANRYAFVVGNDHYVDPAISKLTSCRLDAERIAGYLKSVNGFSIPTEQVELLLDADAETIQTSFIRLLEQIEQPRNSTFYFYYSGHGLPGHIVPTDFKQDDPKDLIAYEWIVSELNKRNIRAKVFVIDACYAGSFIDTKSIPTYSEAAANIFGVETGNTTVAFTATSAYRVTPAGKHESLFTKYFLEGL
ncbi:MAG: caspase family protein, partial [Marinirhabdus sp.]|nr:caspase family protein [Marinirhabdus sp.]